MQRTKMSIWKGCHLWIEDMRKIEVFFSVKIKMVYNWGCKGVGPYLEQSLPVQDFVEYPSPQDLFSFFVIHDMASNWRSCCCKSFIKPPFCNKPRPVSGRKFPSPPPLFLNYRLDWSCMVYSGAGSSDLSSVSSAAWPPTSIYESFSTLCFSSHQTSFSLVLTANWYHHVR